MALAMFKSHQHLLWKLPAPGRSLHCPSVSRPQKIPLRTKTCHSAVDQASSRAALFSLYHSCSRAATVALQSGVTSYSNLNSIQLIFNPYCVFTLVRHSCWRIKERMQPLLDLPVLWYDHVWDKTNLCWSSTVISAPSELQPALIKVIPVVWLLTLLLRGVEVSKGYHYSFPQQQC